MFTYLYVDCVIFGDLRAHICRIFIATTKPVIMLLDDSLELRLALSIYIVIIPNQEFFESSKPFTHLLLVKSEFANIRR